MKRQSVWLHFLMSGTLMVILIATCPANESDQDQGEKISSEFVEFDTPPIIWLTPLERQRIALRNLQGFEKAIAELKESADHAIQQRPHPLKEISYGGYASNHPKRIESVRHLQDMLHMNSLTWYYILSGDWTYGEKSFEFLKAWSSTYDPTGQEVNENKLGICYLTFDVLKERISASDRQKIAGWLKEIADKQKSKWNLKSGSSNKHAKRLKLILMAGIVLDDSELSSFVIEQLEPFLTTAFRGDGTSNDLERRDALHYHMGSVEVSLELSFLIRLLDINLYERRGSNGGSIQKSLHYVFPFVRGEQVHEEWVHTKVGIDKERWKTGDPYYRPGKPWDPSEALPSLIMALPYDDEVRPLIDILSPDRDQATARIQWLTFVVHLISKD